MAALKTAKHELYCLEFCKDLNQTQAAIRAGYAPRSAGQQACELMKKPNIRARISELQATRAAKLELDAEYVLQGFIEVKSRCMQAKPVMIFDQAERRMVQATEEDEAGNEVGLWTFDSKGANTALENIGKHLGMFKDKLDVNLTSPITVVIEDDYGDDTA